VRLVDANVLIYAINSAAPQHAVAREWLDNSLNSTETVGFSWVALLAFIRITTRVGLMPSPLDIPTAMSVVGHWLAQPPAHVVNPGPRHAEILGTLLSLTGSGANLTTDAHLAALAIEQGAELWSFDRDFQQFNGLAFRHLR
jgi:toxin-antitoxin system PIN domain toxin